MSPALSFLIDENLRGELLRRLAKRVQATPGLTLVALQVGDVGAPPLASTDDELLSWCVNHGYCLVSNDRSTIPALVETRAALSSPVPPIFLLRPRTPFRDVVECLILLAEASQPGDWQGGIIWIPL